MAGDNPRPLLWDESDTDLDAQPQSRAPGADTQPELTVGGEIGVLGMEMGVGKTKKVPLAKEAGQSRADR